MWRQQLLCVSSALRTAAIKPQCHCRDGREPAIRDWSSTGPVYVHVSNSTGLVQNQSKTSPGPVKFQSRNDPEPVQDEH